MKKQKAYKFRLYPSIEQKILFEKTFGCSRFIWNQMLADRIAHYEKTGKSLNNTPAQYKEEFPWLKEVDSLSLCNEWVDEFEYVVIPAILEVLNQALIDTYTYDSPISVEELKNLVEKNKIKEDNRLPF